MVPKLMLKSVEIFHISGSFDLFFLKLISLNNCNFEKLTENESHEMLQIAPQYSIKFASGHRPLNACVGFSEACTANTTAILW